MEAPSGEQFLAWSPERAHVASDDALAVSAAWDLVGIDEATFTY
jgi:hypothetical protein